MASKIIFYLWWSSSPKWKKIFLWILKLQWAHCDHKITFEKKSLTHAGFLGWWYQFKKFGKNQILILLADMICWHKNDKYYGGPLNLLKNYDKFYTKWDILQLKHKLVGVLWFLFLAILVLQFLGQHMWQYWCICDELKSDSNVSRHINYF